MYNSKLVDALLKSFPVEKWTISYDDWSIQIRSNREMSPLQLIDIDLYNSQVYLLIDGIKFVDKINTEAPETVKTIVEDMLERAIKHYETINRKLAKIFIDIRGQNG